MMFDLWSVEKSLGIRCLRNNFRFLIGVERRLSASALLNKGKHVPPPTERVEENKTTSSFSNHRLANPINWPKQQSAPLYRFYLVEISRPKFYATAWPSCLNALCFLKASTVCKHTISNKLHLRRLRQFSQPCLLYLSHHFLRAQCALLCHLQTRHQWPTPFQASILGSTSCVTGWQNSPSNSTTL